MVTYNEQLVSLESHAKKGELMHELLLIMMM